MAKVSNAATRVYLDELDLSGVLNSTNLGLDQETPKVDCFADVGPRRVVGNYDYQTSHLGLLEPDDDGYDEALFAALGSGDHYLTQLFGANAAGSVAYDSVVALTAQPRSAQSGGAVLLNFDAAGDQGLVRGNVLVNKVSTGAEDVGALNQGATSAGTIYAVIFRLLAFNGTNITMAIEESQDNASSDAYAAVSGLTSGALTAVGAVRAVTAAATEAWKQVAITGTFTSATVLVTAGVVAGT